MRLGVHQVSFRTPDGAAGIASMLAALGPAVEEAGVDNLSLMDHYLQLGMLGGAQEPMLEGYTTLGFLAAHTRSVELQLLMTGVTYRHPGLLAKIVATLDVLSGGRAASASARRGTSSSTSPTASPSRPSRSGSSDSRRHCASSGRCGATTTVASTARTTSLPRPSAPRSRSTGSP